MTSTAWKYLARLERLHAPYSKLRLRSLRLVFRRARMKVATALLWKNGGAVRSRSGQYFFVDPNDPRAQRLFIERGTLADEVVQLWDRLIETVNPCTIIDVGANYGEVAFSRQYEPSTQVYLIEPNPILVPLLQRSILATQTNFHLIAAAASSSQGEAQLFIDPRSSGVSRLAPSETVSTPSATTVPTVRLDEVVEHPPGAPFVFKIDVEGSEIAVLDGMHRLFETTTRWAGLCEFLPTSNVPLASLHSNFRVSLVRACDFQLEPSTPQRMAQHFASWSADPPLYLRQVASRKAGFLRDVILEPPGRPSAFGLRSPNGAWQGVPFPSIGEGDSP